MKPRKVPTPGWSLEYVMWVFMRVSGAAMILLALVGFGGALYLGARTHMSFATLLRWTFFPLSYHVINSDIPDITLGWVGPYWQVMQMLLVVFGATHGFNGLRLVLEESIHSWGWQIFLRLVLMLLWLGTMGVAFFVILTS